MDRETILNSDDVEIRPVNVWGGVFVKSMSAEERVAYANSLEDDDKTAMVYAKALVHCVVNEKKELLFTPEDAPKLAKKSFTAIKKLHKAADDLNGFSQEKLDELTKN